MFKTLRNAWNVKELRNRLLITVLLLAVYRIGNHIPVPGVNTEALQNAVNQQGSLLSFYDLMNGGALSKSSIFAMGVMPYINASIIMQLLTVAVPYLESLSKEGDDGRKKIQKITRYASIFFGILLSFGTYAVMTQIGAIQSATKFDVFIIMVTLTTASTFLMWLGDQITAKGIGNGISLIICWGIISRIPASLSTMQSLLTTESANIIEIVAVLGVLFVLLVGVIIGSLSERRIPIQYAAKAGGRHFGQTSNIPFNLTGSVVIAIIFAMSVMGFPYTVGQFFPESWFAQNIVNGAYSPFKQNSPQYMIFYVVLIIFFTWFYTQIIYKPDEMAENIHKSSGFIPGVRPGEPTRVYIEKVLNRVAIIGGIFASVVAIFPMILQNTSTFKNLSLGGTALLIVVSVSIEMMKIIESQLVMRHYEGFLRK
ncbi:MAG: preprotein translocase subunit SecY [Clostridiaceae bacterium]